MPISPKELQFQAQKIAEALNTTKPQGVGYVVMFFNRNRDSAVGFACDAVTEDEKRETVKILREFAHHLSPSQIVLPS